MREVVAAPLESVAGVAERSDELVTDAQDATKENPEGRLTVTIVITAFEQSPDGGTGLSRDTRVRWALEEVCQPTRFAVFRFVRRRNPRI